MTLSNFLFLSCMTWLCLTNVNGQSGTLDSTFNNTGLIQLSVNHSNSASFHTSIQSDGKILSCGISGYIKSTATPSNKFICAMVRLQTDGKLDPTFNEDSDPTDLKEGNGKLSISQTDTNDYFLMAKQLPSSKKILVLGRNGPIVFVTRITPNGSIDPTFGPNGYSILQEKREVRSAGMSIQPDGKIVISCLYRYNGVNWQCRIYRLKSEGDLDFSFGINGIVDIPVEEIEETAVAEPLILSNGQIIATGNTYANGKRNFMAVRLNANGSMDKTFGSKGTGKVYFPISRSTSASVEGAILQGDKILMCGWHGNDRYEKRGIAASRLLSNGHLDSTFGNNGIFVYDKLSGDENGNEIIIDKKNNIYVAGSVSVGLNRSFPCVLKIKDNGTIDSTFGKNGLCFIPTNNKEGALTGIALQADGKLVVGGTVSADGVNSNMLIARILTINKQEQRILSDPKLSLRCSEPFSLPILLNSGLEPMVQFSPDILKKDQETYLPIDTGMVQLTISHPGNDSLFAFSKTYTTRVELGKNCPTYSYEIIPYQYLSPNGDQKNDVFYIENLMLYPNNTVQVFNKWGNMVFEQHNYQNNWSGDSLPDGAYYYVIHVTGNSRHQDPIKGNLVISR